MRTRNGSVEPRGRYKAAGFWWGLLPYFRGRESSQDRVKSAGAASGSLANWPANQLAIVAS